ncbi:MAG: helix-turn-helix transcriptional regulator [Dehalococcoidia bacterium]
MEEPPDSGKLEILSPRRQALISALKEYGSGTVEQLAQSANLLPGTTRQHLLALEIEGLVSFDRVRHGQGRPLHVFRLTPRADELFPQRYAHVAISIIESIEQETPELADRIMERFFAEQFHAPEGTAENSDPSASLRTLANMAESNGFVPRLDLEGGLAHLTFRHCPLLKVAETHSRLCDAECEALKRALPGASLVRTAHRLNGDDTCRYEISLAAPISLPVALDDDNSSRNRGGNT